jgi:hypothetical protein
VNFDRDTKDFLVAVEKSNTRMLTDLSRVLEANGKKDDLRVDLLRRDVVSELRWLLIVMILNLAIGVIQLCIRHG